MSDVDPAKEGASPSLSDKYESLRIPSLFDFLLSQEKLAAEIRRQNKEIRSLTDGMKQIKEQIEEIGMEEQPLFVPQEKGITDKDARQILMQALDGIWNLFKAGEKAFDSIVSVVPKKRFFYFGTPAWRSHVETVLCGFSSGLQALDAKIRNSLAEMDIHVIAPERGDLFNPVYHRAIENTAKEPKGEIQEVIQYGYLLGDVVIRYAEVSIN
jgi:hypothetical protein